MTEPGWRPEIIILTRREGLLEYLPTAGSPGEGAAIALLMMMQGISQKSFLAGWANNLEYELWQYSCDGPPADNRGDEELALTERQCTLLRLLSDECDGWWMYPPGPDAEPPLQFVTVAEWKRHIAHYWIHPGGFVSRR
jgi:hypothetical protein